MPYRLVIFDFDGTLADSAAWFHGVINGVALRYGFRTVSDEDIPRLRRQDNRAIIRHLGVPAWKLPFVANHMRGLAARDADRIRLFEGAEALLRGLKERGLVVAVVSSNREDSIRRIMGPEVAGFVDVFACGASLFGKAAKFGRVMRLTGIAARETIAIGDEARDIEAATQAGIASGAVSWGYADPDFLRERSPTVLFERMDDIVGAVAA
ncbi:HAD hydrolase-like protein [Salinarimonas soli]|uniref:HAD hydrolase-like protein n=1 Tax=Salinarimonas soli TaxID=1638099 RepID=A0A5B2V789_9HYPH|nr:HAD hydrolase-like protein [Salinarimonas soli]KAA2234831.1 HAD hydrolase-like protein [Salinarimonas soli]